MGLCKITAINISALLFSFLSFFSGILLAQKPQNETSSTSVKQNSVKGSPLETCSLDRLTGFYRDGFCRTSEQDYGSHTVCARMTKEFLEFTKTRGNDLSTPKGQFFPGLKNGDYWCLCAVRWLQGFKMGKVTPVKLKATHLKAMEVIHRDILEKVDDYYATAMHVEFYFSIIRKLLISIYIDHFADVKYITFQ